MNSEAQALTKWWLLLHLFIITGILSCFLIIHAPGILTSDSAGQWGQALHNSYSDWHPVPLASSKTCSCCGHLHDKMPLAIRNFKCEKCGVEHDRDINAAKNLENLLDLWVKDQAAAGQAVFGRGGLVRLDKATTLTSGVLGSVNPPSSTYA